MPETQPRGAVLITGTSTGIGKKTALHLDQLGFQVFATVRKEADAEALRSEGTGNLTPLLMDVTDPDSITRARDEVGETAGEAGLAGLVNNAGVGIGGPLEFFPLEDLRWLFEVNLFGLLAVTQAFLPLLRRAKGRVFNVSSTATIMHAPFHGPYTMTKLALNGLSNALRLELRPHGVGVSLLIVGSIKTPIWDKGREQNITQYEKYPPEAETLYGEAHRKLGAFFTRMGKAGLPPETVALVVEHALTSARPKDRYLIGENVRLFDLASKILPSGFQDRMMQRAIGLDS